MVMVPYLFHYNTLLQNATDIITKCDSYFITKYAISGFLLENATVITNALILLQYATFITKCVSAIIQ